MKKGKILAVLLAAVTAISGSLPFAVAGEEFYSDAGQGVEEENCIEESEETKSGDFAEKSKEPENGNVAELSEELEQGNPAESLERLENDDLAEDSGEKQNAGFTGFVTDADENAENTVTEFSSEAEIEASTDAGSENSLFEGYDEVIPGTIAGDSSDDGIAVFSLEEYTYSYGAQLEANAKALYDQLVQNYVGNYQAFQDTLEFTFVLPEAISYEAVVENGKYQMSGDSYNAAVKELKYIVQAATDAFAYDYPQAFWFRGCGYRFGGNYNLDSTSSTGYRGYISQIKFMPEAYEIYENAHKQMGEFMVSVQAVVAKLQSETSKMSQYEKVRAIHDYICKLVTYKNDGTLLVHTAAPAFIGTDRGFVCEGYAKSMKILCYYMGINCACVSGMAKSTLNGTAGAHMWNYVQMDDSRWYLVDATWDDSGDITKPAVSSKYFLAGRQTKGMYITIGQERTEYTSFSTAADGSASPKFILPVLADDAYVYKADTPGTDPKPSVTPSPAVEPTKAPEPAPSVSVTPSPSAEPTKAPEPDPSVSVTPSPSAEPTKAPEPDPSVSVTPSPSAEPTKAPEPDPAPSVDVTPSPSAEPTKAPEPTQGANAIVTPSPALPAPAPAKTTTETLPLKVKQTYKVSGKIKSIKSSSKKVAAVDKNGTITGKKAGTATVTVTFTNKTKKIYKVKVQKGTVKTKSLVLNKKKVILAKKGKTFRLKVSVTPVTSQQKVTFKSSKPKVVTVTSSGKITARKKGTATITVKSGSKSVTCKVIVKK